MNSKRAKQLRQLAQSTGKPLRSIKSAYQRLNKTQKEFFLQKLKEGKK